MSILDYSTGCENLMQKQILGDIETLKAKVLKREKDQAVSKAQRVTMILDNLQYYLKKGLSISSACDLINVNRVHIYKILKRYGISPDDIRSIFVEDYRRLSHPAKHCPFCGSTNFIKKRKELIYICGDCGANSKIRFITRSY